jgi:nucleoside-diphosphate-sugar epimerase
MRVLILGGTLFIGRRIALELLARGDDVMVVHRGQTEPAELSGCAHVHAARDALAGGCLTESRDVACFHGLGGP